MMSLGNSPNRFFCKGLVAVHVHVRSWPLSGSVGLSVILHSPELTGEFSVLLVDKSLPRSKSFLSLGIDCRGLM